MLTVHTLSFELIALATRSKELAREAMSRDGCLCPRELATAYVAACALGDRLAEMQKQLQTNKPKRWA